MRGALGILLALLVVTGLFSGIATAQEVRSGDRVVVGPDETVSDLTAFAGTVAVQGTVDGDLVALGGHVLIEGEVTGDVSAVAGTVRVTGEVGGEVNAAAGNVVVGEGATVDALLAAAGSVAIEGTVADDVEVVAGGVTLGPAASIGGDLTYGGELNRHPDAEVDGTVSQVVAPGPGPTGEVPTLPWWLGQAYWLVVNLVLGAILLALFPRFSDCVARTAREEALRSGGVGLLALIGIPIVLVLVAITVVGIPLSIAGVLAFAVLVWIATVYGRFAVGVWLLSLADVEDRWAALVVGLLAVALVGWVPFLGSVIDLVVLLLGLGALALALHDRYDEQGRSPETAESTVARR